MLPAFLVYRHTRHFSLHPSLHHYSLFAYRGWTRPVVPPNFPPKPNQRPPPSPHPVCKSCVKKTNFMWVCQLVSLAVCLCYLPNCFSPFLSHTNSPYCPSLSSAELCMSLSHTHTHTWPLSIRPCRHACVRDSHSLSISLALFHRYM